MQAYLLYACSFHGAGALRSYYSYRTRFEQVLYAIRTNIIQNISDIS